MGMFDNDKAPALSFKDATPGAKKSLRLTEVPENLVQGLDFSSGEPATWPSKDGYPPEPKLSAVLKGTAKDGSTASIWATKPSNLFEALGNALREAGVTEYKEGGLVEVEYTGDRPHPTNKNYNPIKLYAVKYTPPENKLSDSPVWGGSDQPESEPF